MNAMRAEVLISRMIDGEAGTDEWQEFSALAAAAPELWRELADAQRQQSLLSAAVAEATSVAAKVELPDLSAGALEPLDDHVPVISMAWQRKLSAWVGWGVAAALAIALWSGVRPTANTSGPSSGNDGSASSKTQLASFAPAELLAAYLDVGKEDGQVLGELPDKVLLETRPDPSTGGYEVFFIRTIVERTHVPELYQFGSQDESGRPVLAKYRHRSQKPL